MTNDSVYHGIEIAGVKEKALDCTSVFSFFYEIVRYYMSEANITIEELEARTGVPNRTIKQMRSESESEHRFELRYIVAVSIGLHMLSAHSFALIHLNGYGLRCSNRLERFYFFLLTECSDFSVSACNDFLIEHGLPPLTDKEINSYV